MVTIDDVARHAGVSSSTVSYVLSGKRTISVETSDRVTRSVAELGYRPNASARALASRRSNALALVAPFRADNNVPVLMQFVSEVATAARERNRDVLLVTQEEGDEGVRRVSHSALVDAVIVMDLEIEDARLPMLRELNLPCVLIGQPDHPGRLSFVDLDLREAAEVGLNHLAELGHSTIAMLGSPPAVYQRRSSYAVRFAEGFEHAGTKRGATAVWYPVEQSYESVNAVITKHFEKYPDTTALMVHNEAILGTVLAILERGGRRVPNDVSIVAVCPTDMAENQRVPLTHIPVPAALIGAAAVEMVIRQLDGDSSVEKRLIYPELTVRASTSARAPSAATASASRA
ncbi:MAG: LacI family transcriptional regulator [Cryobacterium sp.]|jgi:DNA-binding LacI/PurR family transcriptional regulator|nr:LacI family transcriptional regulator [Cryobacterium sp.]